MFWCLSLCSVVQSQPITRSGDSTVLYSHAMGCQLVLTAQAHWLGVLYLGLSFLHGSEVYPPSQRY